MFFDISASRYIVQTSVKLMISQRIAAEGGPGAAQNSPQHGLLQLRNGDLRLLAAIILLHHADRKTLYQTLCWKLFMNCLLFANLRAS